MSELSRGERRQSAPAAAVREPLQDAIGLPTLACTAIQCSQGGLPAADPRRRKEVRMKLAISREALLEACRLAPRRLPEPTVAAASSHVLLRAGGGGCALHATDHEASLGQQLPARVE